MPHASSSSIDHAASVGDQPSPEDIRAQLRRILADPTLQANSVRREFLGFVVEETLAGRADRLKGSTIALAVFGRDVDFAAQSDPVVRVEARRLRRDLDSYYVAAGKGDPVIISIPKGGYVPQFERRDVKMAPDAPPPGVPQIDGPGAAAPSTSDARPGRGRVAFALLAAALLGVFGWLGASWLDTGSDRGAGMAADLPQGPRIAVLPFRSLGDDPDQAYFASGITEQIVTDLARFRALFVLTPRAAANEQASPADLADLKRKLGVDYVLSASVRREADQIRLSTRLVDAESGRVVWSETYGDALTPSRVFEIQEDVSRQVSATLASSYGVIADEGQTDAQRQPPATLAAYDCVLRYYAYQRFFDREEHARVRACLERAVELDPDYADAWAVLANIYAQEHRFGYNPRPDLYDSRERSLATAQRAVEIEPRNPTAQLMLANALFDRREFVKFKVAGERAVALNPNDPEPLVHFGSRLVYMGDWARGLTLVTKAIALNPGHPEWYRDSIIYHDYQTEDYEQALAESRKQQVHRPWRYLFQAMILGQLGRTKEARPLIASALERKPDVRERFWHMARIWNMPDRDIEHMADGLRKAGLAIAPAPPAS